MAVIRIATRQSPLALWQAEYVAERLRGLDSGTEVRLLPMTTLGDKFLDAPLAKFGAGGKALFLKELETALLDGRADIAVHSMKDVPVQLPPDLHLPVVMTREDPRDALVSSRYSNLASLPPQARVGTSSLRRRCQLQALRPDLEVVNLRGNVNTRLRKLDDGEFEAIVLAASGLKRLGMTARISEIIEPRTLLPAIGQGALGIECRQGDRHVEALVAQLDDAQAHLRISAERSLNRCLGGSCHAPIAGYAEIEADMVNLRGLVGRIDGSEVLREEVTVPAKHPDLAGQFVAEALVARGAAKILQDITNDV